LAHLFLKHFFKKYQHISTQISWRFGLRFALKYLNFFRQKFAKAPFWAIFGQNRALSFTKRLVTLMIERYEPGLPDFSCYNLPKREKYSK
jgi:hypothetical protein